MSIIHRTEVHSSNWQHLCKRLLIMLTHDCAVFKFVIVIVNLSSLKMARSIIHWLKMCNEQFL